MPGTRPAGWYPDPWGTPEERWFDGAAWTPRTRAPAASPDAARAVGTGAEPAAGAPDAAPATERAGGTSVAPSDGVPAARVPAGWYPDPWGAAPLRFWDGAAWTGFVSGHPAGPALGEVGARDAPAGPGGTAAAPAGTDPAAALLARQLADEQVHARLARAALGVAGPAAAIGVVGLASRLRWVIDRWPALRDPQRRSGALAELTGGFVAVVGQIVVATLLVAAVMFLLWWQRAARVAARSGAGGDRWVRPGRALGAFFVPVANLWLPYLVARGLAAGAQDARRLAGRWWAAVVGFVAASVAMVTAAFWHVPTMSVLAGLSVALALGAAGAGRRFVDAVTRVHAGLAGPGLTTSAEHTG